MEPYRPVSIICDISFALWPWGSLMPDERLLALARDCRERAEEVSVKADTFQDADAKQRMLEIAAQYRDLAKRLERAAADT
jgi:hypothetical protein